MCIRDRLSAAMLAGLPTNYLRLLMVVLFIAALLLNNTFGKKGAKRA